MYNSNYSASQSPSHVTNQDEASALSLLQHLDKSDLQQLLDVPDKLEDLVTDASRGIKNEKQTLLTSNKSLAEYNISLQPKLDELKGKVATGYEEINTIKTELGKDKAKLDTLIGEQSLDTILALLQTETAKSEEESEEMADAFCDNKASVDEFLGKYISQRTIAHLRRVKVEKMTDLLRNLHAENHPTLHRQQNAAASSTPWNPAPPSHGPSQTPYPINPTDMRMPQPGYYGR